MTLQNLIEKLADLYAAGAQEDTEIIYFAEISDGVTSVAIQMDTLSISLNGDCVQLFMQGDN